MRPDDPNRVPVFAGPTLYRTPALPRPFVPYPPAAAGDLLQLLNGPPCTVILIDGLFDERPAAWHKEILILLGHGFRVIGAASMGALRAAELQSFGMMGTGAIFQAYASGRISGDDEVALAHATVKHRFKPVSVPQVNVRATLASACRHRIISVEDAKAFRTISQNIFYKERVWATIVDQARAAGLSCAELTEFVAKHPIDLKAIDAYRALGVALSLVNEVPIAHPMPPITPFLLNAARFAGLSLASPVESGDDA